MPITPEFQERLVRLEADVENIEIDMRELKGDIRSAVRELTSAVADLKLALAIQGGRAATELAKPLARLDGMKLALVGLGGIIVFFVTVLGGILGIVSWFRPGTLPPH